MAEERALSLIVSRRFWIAVLSSTRLLRGPCLVCLVQLALFFHIETLVCWPCEAGSWSDDARQMCLIDPTLICDPCKARSRASIPRKQYGRYPSDLLRYDHGQIRQMWHQLGSNSVSATRSGWIRGFSELVPPLPDLLLVQRAFSGKTTTIYSAKNWFDPVSNRGPPVSRDSS
jgi:hypothetical protein